MRLSYLGYRLVSGYINVWFHFVVFHIASLCCQDETGSKPDGRGDSAVSKGTADSGVVMEDGQIPALPGQMPRKLPPLPGVRENELDRVTQDGEYMPYKC